MKHLYYGDNLDVLRGLPSESVDLVYLDPPFNSARNYNVIFARAEHENNAGAQIQAFEDTWEWTPATEEQFNEYLNGGLPFSVAEALRAFHTLLGENDALAYLVNMAPRLVELHRLLTSKGSLYLHCDPTMSHYLKILLDATFDPRNFRNEIIWKRSTGVKGNAGQGAKHFGRSTDTILYYAKSKATPYYQQYKPYTQEAIDKQFKHIEEGTGRRYSLDPIDGPGGAAKGNPFYEVFGVKGFWRYKKEVMEQLIAEGKIVQTKPGTKPRRKKYLEEGKGVPVQSLWDDIPNLQASSAEALGYPTQKPLTLLERIIETSTKPGDIVLDPFCGCGTTVDAAQKLGREWLGIDITYIAIDLILKRLEHTHGADILKEIEINGLPRDAGAAQALFDRNPFDFERWAVSFINAQPNEKQVGDRGIDGVARFPLDGTRKNIGRVLVSVKGGKQLNPAMVRDLSGTVNTQKAEMGVLITQHEPTRGMIEEANHGGTYTHPANGQKFPRIQIITTSQLLASKRPELPLIIPPYIQARPAQLKAGAQQLF